MKLTKMRISKTEKFSTRSKIFKKCNSLIESGDDFGSNMI